MYLRSLLSPIATCACLFLLLSANSSSQTLYPRPLPAELTRPELFSPESKLTPEEQSLLDAFGKLDLKDNATSIKVISGLIAEYPTVGSGYAIRASQYGCESAEPNIEKAYEDANRAH